MSNYIERLEDILEDCVPFYDVMMGEIQITTDEAKKMFSDSCCVVFEALKGDSDSDAEDVVNAITSNKIKQRQLLSMRKQFTNAQEIGYMLSVLDIVNDRHDILCVSTENNTDLGYKFAKTVMYARYPKSTEALYLRGIFSVEEDGDVNTTKEIIDKVISEFSAVDSANTSKGFYDPIMRVNNNEGLAFYNSMVASKRIATVIKDPVKIDLIANVIMTHYNELKKTGMDIFIPDFNSPEEIMLNIGSFANSTVKYVATIDNGEIIFRDPEDADTTIDIEEIDNDVKSTTNTIVQMNHVNPVVSMCNSNAASASAPTAATIASVLSGN